MREEQQKTGRKAQTKKNVTDFYVSGVLSTLKRGKMAKEDTRDGRRVLRARFFGVVTVNDKQNRIQIA